MIVFVVVVVVAMVVVVIVVVFVFLVLVLSTFKAHDLAEKKLVTDGTDGRAVRHDLL